METLTVVSLGQIMALEKLFEQQKSNLTEVEQKEIENLLKDLATNKDFEVSISGTSAGTSFGNKGTEKAIEYLEIIADECTDNAQYEDMKIIHD